MISILAASRNNVIGNKGGLPWSFKKDMKWFKTITTIELFNNLTNTVDYPNETRYPEDRNIVVMGGGTWRSLNGKPLPNRENWILSRNAMDIRELNPECKAFESESYLLDSLYKVNKWFPRRNIFCIGGVSIYDLVEPEAFVVTEIDGDFEGDTTFDWRKSGKEFKIDSSSVTFSDINTNDGKAYAMRTVLVLNLDALHIHSRAYYRYLFEKALDKSGIAMLS